MLPREAPYVVICCCAPTRALAATGCRSTTACAAFSQVAGQAAGAHSADALQLANGAGLRALVPGLHSLHGLRHVIRPRWTKRRVEAFLTHLAAERQVAVSTHRRRCSRPCSFFTKVLEVQLPWMAEMGLPMAERQRGVAQRPGSLGGVIRGNAIAWLTPQPPTRPPTPPPTACSPAAAATAHPTRSAGWSAPGSARWPLPGR